MTSLLHPDLIERLRTAKQIVVFSGAGLSAESGIPTFRDSKNSLWANTDPMAVASLQGFELDPEKVWAWHEDMRKLFADAKPNPGHDGIALLEMLLQPAKVRVITQNIDGFHQEAGSSWVAEIHGTTTRVRCHRRCGYVAKWEGDTQRQCPICGAPVRPDVVWFGEALDEMLFQVAEDSCESADIFFAVGTSGVVQPAASLALLAKNAGALTVEVNFGETPFTPFADISVRASASDFFTELCKGIRAMRLRQVRK